MPGREDFPEHQVEEERRVTANGRIVIGGIVTDQRRRAIARPGPDARSLEETRGGGGETIAGKNIHRPLGVLERRLAVGPVDLIQHERGEVEGIVDRRGIEHEAPGRGLVAGADVSLHGPRRIQEPGRVAAPGGFRLIEEGLVKRREVAERQLGLASVERKAPAGSRAGQ